MKHRLFLTICFSFLLCVNSALGLNRSEGDIIQTIKKTYLSWVERDYKQWQANCKPDDSSTEPRDNPLEFQLTMKGGLSMGNAIRMAKGDIDIENFSNFEIRICEQQAIAKFTLNGRKKSAFLEKNKGQWEMVSVADLNPNLCDPAKILSKMKNMSGLYHLDLESLNENYSWTLNHMEMGISEIEGGISIHCQYRAKTASGEVVHPIHHIDLLVNTQNSQISHLGSIQWTYDLRFVYNGNSCLRADGTLVSESTFQNDDGKRFRQLIYPEKSGNLSLKIYEFDERNKPVLMIDAVLEKEHLSAASL